MALVRADWQAAANAALAELKVLVDEGYAAEPQPVPVPVPEPTPEPVPDPVPVPQPSDVWFGNPLIADGIGNTNISASGKWVSHRFVAKYSGKLVDARLYLIKSTTKIGYSEGDGGIIRAFIYSNKGTNNVPGSILGQCTNDYARPVTNSLPAMWQYKFAGVDVEAGQVYHLVLRNVHSSPGSNWCGSDDLYLHDYDPSRDGPRNAVTGNLDNAILITRDSGATWGYIEYRTSINDFGLADGRHFGQAFIQPFRASSDAERYHGKISGQYKLRQTFTPTESFVASRFGFWVRRDAGDKPLTVSVAGQSFEILASAIRYAPGNVQVSGPKFVHRDISPISFQAGQKYTVTFSAPSDTVYVSYPMQSGCEGYGYSPQLSLGGRCEKSTDGGQSWSGWRHYGADNRSDTDLSFYFRS